MQVILREDVPTSAAPARWSTSSRATARNYLIPRGLAVARRATCRARPREAGDRGQARARAQGGAQRKADKLDGLVIEILARAGEEDRLYGSVTNLDIAQHLSERGVKVDRRRIDLDDPIKRLGTYRIVVGIAHDVKATITVKVLPETVAE